MDMNIWLIIDGNQENDLELENGLKLKLKIVFRTHHIVKIRSICNTCKPIQILAFP